MLRVFGLWLIMTIAAVGTVVGQSGNIDPVGSYEFTTITNNQTVTGKVTISKTETGWSALVEGGQMPPMTTTSVKVEGKDVTVTVPFGDIGEVVVEFTIDGDDVTGRWIFGMESGDITGKRISGNR